MCLIRIYHIPKGYTDVICNSVDVDGKIFKVTVRGGQQDGKEYYHSSGAKVLKENVYEQLQLELDYGD